MDLGSSSYAALVDAIMNAKPAPKPADTGVIYNPQEMERQRFEEHTGYNPTVSDLQNLIAAWKGNKILDAPIPGANPEVGTPGDAMVGALTGALSRSGSASNPMADVLGQTAGGGMAQQQAPGGRIRPDVKYRGPLAERIKGKVYRETDAGEAEQMLMGRNAGDDRYYATSKNLALGQGRNRGIKLESDPRQLEGKIDRTKPASRMLETKGHGEILANANTAKNLQDSIRRVTVDKSLKRDKLERAQTTNLIKKLAREGWTRTEQGSNIILKRPASALKPATSSGDTVVVYGTGPWMSVNPQRGASYRESSKPLLRLEMPRDVFEAGKAEAKRTGQPTKWDTVVPNEWLKKATKVDIPDGY